MVLIMDVLVLETFNILSGYFFLLVAEVAKLLKRKSPEHIYMLIVLWSRQIIAS